jgi:hypothetical protein
MLCTERQPPVCFYLLYNLLCNVLLSAADPGAGIQLTAANNITRTPAGTVTNPSITLENVNAAEAEDDGGDDGGAK